VNFQEAAKALPANQLKFLLGIFAQVAIYQEMTTDGVADIDANDVPFGYNMVVAWGEFTTLKLLLWQCQQAIEVKPSDAIFFLDRVFTHNAISIIGGKQNILNYSTHFRLVEWSKKTLADDTITLAQNSVAWPKMLNRPKLQVEKESTIESNKDELTIMIVGKELCAELETNHDCIR
jgi:hypothetical protein